MAVTIGEITDVPDPGSPLASAWAQEITKRIVQRFTTVTQRDTLWPAATAGEGAICYVAATDVLYTSNGTAWIAGTGATGPTGPAGATGAAGPGVPTGGTQGQRLTKQSSTDYDTAWTTTQAVVAKSTTPVAADYGLPTIPVGAIWVQSP
jgi:hypothetical protein